MSIPHGRPVPVFGDGAYRFDTSVLAEWLASTNTQTLSDWKGVPRAILQLLDIRTCPVSGALFVIVSDGPYWVNGILGPDMEILFNRGLLKHNEVVEVIKTGGHPYGGSEFFQLVRF